MAAESAAQASRINELLEQKALLENQVDRLLRDRDLREQQMNDELDLQTQEFEKQFKALADQLDLLDRREDAVRAREEAVRTKEEYIKENYDDMEAAELEVGRKQAGLIVEIDAFNTAKAKLVEEMDEFDDMRDEFDEAKDALDAEKAQFASEKASILAERSSSSATAAELDAKLREVQELQQKLSEAQAACVKSQQSEENLQKELAKAHEDLKELRDQLQHKDERIEKIAQGQRHPVREMLESWKRCALEDDQLKLSLDEQKILEDASTMASMSSSGKHQGRSSQSPAAAVSRDSTEKLLGAMDAGEQRTNDEKAERVFSAASRAMLNVEGLRLCAALEDSGGSRHDKHEDLAFALHDVEVRLMEEAKARKPASFALNTAAVLLLSASGSCKRCCSQRKDLKEEVSQLRKQLSQASAALRKSPELVKSLGEAVKEPGLPDMLDKADKALRRLNDVATCSTKAWKVLDDFQSRARRFAVTKAAAPNSSPSDLRMLLSWLFTDMRAAQSRGESAADAKDRPGAATWLEMAALFRQKRASYAAAGSTPAKRVKTGER
eukprot:TRINITY_DN23312_c0_g1_i1.p1 TRINITY_DN23312_c0_g1~~TRINITY_DN23312_c0_g1_i1.p1  ORF type:complete len:555 (-),score=168.77 TRINITY_DN23312_c0_g1_i1:89-1753(-)